MSEPTTPQGPLSTIAKLSGRPLAELHRLWRLPGAPSPTGHVAQINVYDLNEAMHWLHIPPDGKNPPESAPQPQTPIDLAANRRQSASALVNEPEASEDGRITTQDG